MNWWKEKVFPNLMVGLIGALTSAVLIMSGKVFSTQISNAGQLWVPNYTIVLSATKNCADGWRNMGQGILEIAPGNQALFRAIDHPDGKGTLHKDMAIADSGKSTVKDWDLTRFYICMRHDE